MIASLDFWGESIKVLSYGRYQLCTAHSGNPKRNVLHVFTGLEVVLAELLMCGRTVENALLLYAHVSLLCKLSASNKKLSLGDHRKETCEEDQTTTCTGQILGNHTVRYSPPA